MNEKELTDEVVLETTKQINYEKGFRDGYDKALEKAEVLEEYVKSWIGESPCGHKEHLEESDICVHCEAKEVLSKWESKK